METYGICLDAAMTGAYTAPFVAALCNQLPMSCRWRVSYDEDAWWDTDRVLMASLVNSLNGLIWGMADRKRRGPRPKIVGPSWMRGHGRKVPATVMSKRALLRELAKPRRARE
jgi:hypothetical protein